MADSDPLIYAVIGFFAGIFLFVNGFRWKHQMDLIRNTPTSKIRSIAMGLVEIFGQANLPQGRISGLENELADRREFYNDSVNTFNIRIESFPDMIIAGMMRLARKDMFKIAEEDKKDVKVEF